MFRTGECGAYKDYEIIYVTFWESSTDYNVAGNKE